RHHRLELIPVDAAGNQQMWAGPGIGNGVTAKMRRHDYGALGALNRRAGKHQDTKVTKRRNSSVFCVLRVFVFRLRSRLFILIPRVWIFGLAKSLVFGVKATDWQRTEARGELAGFSVGDVIGVKRAVAVEGDAGVGVALLGVVLQVANMLPSLAFVGGDCGCEGRTLGSIVPDKQQVARGGDPANRGR